MHEEEEEDTFEYDYVEPAKYILEHISASLREKLSLDDVITLLQIEDDYINECEQETATKKPFIPFDLVTIHQEDINRNVLNNAVRHNIILTPSEIEEIMDTELAYMEIRGEITDSHNLN
jgi:hypothetical protein